MIMYEVVYSGLTITPQEVVSVVDGIVTLPGDLHPCVRQQQLQAPHYGWFNTWVEARIALCRYQQEIVADKQESLDWATEELKDIIKMKDPTRVGKNPIRTDINEEKGSE